METPFGRYFYMIFQSSWDDASRFDIRLSALLKKYHIDATFYVPTETTELSEKQIWELSQDFEIGSHTRTHPNLTRIDHAQAVWEIESSKKKLEKIIDKKVLSFCYPKGYFNEDVKQIVKDAGYIRARTTVMEHIDTPTDLFEEWTTVHVYPRHEKLYDNWYTYAISKFEKAMQEDGYFHIWGHSHELEKYQLWRQLERFLKIVDTKREHIYRE